MRDSFNEINITPLTDIFLVLLIIMMVIAPMLDQQGLNLAVPEVVNAEQIKKELALFIDDMPTELHFGFKRTAKFREFLKDALSLIKKLTEENEKLHASCTEFERKCASLNDENERLRAENAKYEAENHAEFNKWLKLEEATKRHHAELFEDAKIAVKEDTVRKMQERLTLEFNRFHKSNFITPEVRQWIIDHIAKEMIGEGK